MKNQDFKIHAGGFCLYSHDYEHRPEQVLKLELVKIKPVSGFLNPRIQNPSIQNCLKNYCDIP
ncbi:hypothetical protein [Scytonema sp. NUACC26]|uniref:hypothetical protein n=1 Tax=Scytonema sp. NUACC26 TaxID=3140176 RepID=UPI0038B2A0E4